MTLKPIEGIRTYRFPTIEPSYGHYGHSITQVCHPHARPSATKVSSCVIDTPRDDEQTYRENLWSFQRSHRGVKQQDEDLPEIPFRLRQSDTEPSEHAMEQSLGFPYLDSYGSGSVTDGSLVRQLTRTRSFVTTSDPIPPMRETPLLAKGVSVPFTKSLRLISRDRSSTRSTGTRQNGGSISERLPRLQRSKPEVSDVSSLKKTSSLMDVREDSFEGTSPCEIDNLSNVSIDITSDKVGHTTNATIDTTLADILNRHNNGKYYDLRNKRSNELDLNHTVKYGHGSNQWTHKFETKVVDGNAYDSFARTRKPEMEKETKCETTSGKRALNQKPSESDNRTSSNSTKDGYSNRKNGSGLNKKHSKLKISLSSRRTID